MDDTGNFAITWSSEDQDGFGIFAQRFDASGKHVGEEFQVNTYTSQTQADSVIAMDPYGNFVITWRSAGQDGSSYGIFAQAYESDGNKHGIEYQVNTYIKSSQSAPDAAMNNLADIVISWQSKNQVASKSEFDIFARQFKNPIQPN